MSSKIGSRAQVMHGNAIKTTGGLMKKDLKYNKQGKIVSKKASALAKKNNRLVKAGYVTKKGQFGVAMRGGTISTKARETAQLAAVRRHGENEIARIEQNKRKIRSKYDDIITLQENIFVYTGVDDIEINRSSIPTNEPL